MLIDGPCSRLLTGSKILPANASPRVADTSLSDLRVAREMEALIERRSKPLMIMSDNGTELTSRAILAFAQDRRIEWHYIAPGKPTQNAFIESLSYKILSPDRIERVAGMVLQHHPGGEGGSFVCWFMEPS